ncbi:unnamed protein product [Rotaria magnacalcarata]|uniref:Uncharacterized protein n=6 Tax=Rotaria magnacalcarata TaxID=392030 RepID=A0A8S2Y5F0_9BILA|nr:unnamed protein product [Rotaria magnacalcarata]
MFVVLHRWILDQIWPVVPNHRLQQLLSSSLLRLKIQVHRSESNEIMMNSYNKIVLHNKQQIFSITIWTLEKIDPMASSFNFINSSKIDSFTTLPTLKYIKYMAPDSEDSNTTISLPAGTKEQITSIEYFIIGHFCTYDQLSNLLSYTPNLRYLKYLNLYRNNSDVQSIKSGIVMSSFRSHYYTQLSARQQRDEEFYFRFQPSLDSEYQTPPYSGAQHPFMSRFWIQRQWILDTEIEFDNIIHSIQSVHSSSTMNSFDEWSKSMRLVLSYAYQEKWCKSLTVKDYIRHVLTVTQIYHLDIACRIIIDKLSNVLQMLPKLDLLEIYRFLYTSSDDPFFEDIQSLFDLAAKN